MALTHSNYLWQSKPLGLYLAAMGMALALGLASWLVGATWLAIGLVALVVLILLISHPKETFILWVFSLPFVLLNYKYIHAQDVLIWTCWLGISIRWLFLGGPSTKLSTPIDAWLAIILALFMWKGFGSVDFERGSLHALRFIESLLGYYATVYFVRTRQVTLKILMRYLILIGVLEVIYGLFQTTTGLGYFHGPTYESRGYLAYLGLGPKLIPPPNGTFWHWISYGQYLTAMAVFMLGWTMYIKPHSRKFFWGLAALSLGVMFSYSRGALAGYLMTLAYFTLLVPKLPTRYSRWIGGGLLASIPVMLFIIFKTDFSESLNPRDDIWSVNFYYLRHHPWHMWLGSGFESRLQTFLNDVPAWTPYALLRQFDPHNLYLAYVHSIGILGSLVFFSFLGWLFVRSWLYIYVQVKAITQRGGADNDNLVMLAINTGYHLMLFSVFFGGANDHTYYEPYLNMSLMFWTALVTLGQTQVSASRSPNKDGPSMAPTLATAAVTPPNDGTSRSAPQS
jgi:hypothetical protein